MFISFKWPKKLSRLTIFNDVYRYCWLSYSQFLWLFRSKKLAKIISK